MNDFGKQQFYYPITVLTGFLMSLCVLIFFNGREKGLFESTIFNNIISNNSEVQNLVLLDTKVFLYQTSRLLQKTNFEYNQYKMSSKILVDFFNKQDQEIEAYRRLGFLFILGNSSISKITKDGMIGYNLLGYSNDRVFESSKLNLVSSTVKKAMFRSEYYAYSKNEEFNLNILKLDLESKL